MIFRFVNWILSWFRNGTGFLRQALDRRDFLYGKNFSVSGVCSDKVDLRDNDGSVRNQLTTNACTGFAASGLLENILGFYYGYRWRVSSLWLWYWGKKLHGWETENKGVWLRYTIKALFSFGWVKEISFPFRVSFLRSPSEKVGFLADLSKLWLKDFGYYLLKVSEVRFCLNDGLPVVFGININKSFSNNHSGVISLDDPIPHAGHAMLVVGFDDERELFLVKNSWGKRWGDGGYCWIPYEYFYRYAHDCWTIRKKGGVV